MAFLALRLPLAGQDALATELASWRQAFPEVAWMHPSDLHLTLRFLAGNSPLFLNSLRQILVQEPLHVPSFSLRLKGRSSFAEGRREVILWIGEAFGDQKW